MNKKIINSWGRVFLTTILAQYINSGVSIFDLNGDILTGKHNWRPMWSDWVIFGAITIPSLFLQILNVVDFFVNYNWRPMWSDWVIFGAITIPSLFLKYKTYE